MKLCSACLLGIACRYDGKSKPNQKVVELSKNEILIPVCPEQLGGLSTPREGSRRKTYTVETYSGKDVTVNYTKGAEEVLKLAKLYGITEGVFKERSPSCGVNYIYKGETVVPGCGVTAELLKKHGITLVSEEEL